MHSGRGRGRPRKQTNPQKYGEVQNLTEQAHKQPRDTNQLCKDLTSDLVKLENALLKTLNNDPENPVEKKSAVA